MVLLAVDAMVLGACPAFSGLRHADIDLGPVTFLRQHLGLQRCYTIGRLAPNYAAYFQIASINYLYLPIVDSWIRYIQSSLDPGVVDPVNFLGDYPAPTENREEALRAHLYNFETTAVKYAVTKTGKKAFSGVLSSDLLKTGYLLALNVTIGTYGKATGWLEVQLCGK